MLSVPQGRYGGSKKNGVLKFYVGEILVFSVKSQQRFIKGILIANQNKFMFS